MHKHHCGARTLMKNARVKEKGTVNSLFRTQVLTSSGQQICFSDKCNVFVQLWILVGTVVSAQHLYLLISNQAVA